MLLIEVKLAGHDCLVVDRGAFPQALLVELGTCALEAYIPRGAWLALERHRLAIHHALLLTPSDTSDQVAFVSASASLAEERFESLDHLGDRHGFEASDLGRRCSVHG